MTSINYTSLDNCLSSTEQWANKAGWIPGVSLVTGYCRYGIGKIQVIASLAYAAFKFIESLFTGDASKQEGYLALHYAIHGLGNMVRGFVEMTLFIGNLFCFLYDMTGARMNYPREAANANNPIFSANLIPFAARNV